MEQEPECRLSTFLQEVPPPAPAAPHWSSLWAGPHKSLASGSTGSGNTGSLGRTGEHRPGKAQCVVPGDTPLRLGGPQGPGPCPLSPAPENTGGDGSIASLSMFQTCSHRTRTSSLGIASPPQSARTQARVLSPATLESAQPAARVGGTERARPVSGSPSASGLALGRWGSFPGNSSPLPPGDILLTGTLNRLCIYALYPLLLENQPRQSHLTPLPRRARVKISWGLGCLLPQRFPWELCGSLSPVTAPALIGSRKAPQASFPVLKCHLTSHLVSSLQARSHYQQEQTE